MAGIGYPQDNLEAARLQRVRKQLGAHREETGTWRRPVHGGDQENGGDRWEMNLQEAQEENLDVEV